MQGQDSFDAAVKKGAMPLLKILIWLKWPNMILPSEDDNHIGIRLAFANQDRFEKKKKRANPGEDDMKITDQQVEVGI